MLSEREKASERLQIGACSKSSCGAFGRLLTQDDNEEIIDWNFCRLRMQRGQVCEAVACRDPFARFWLY
jgi:hypothetical protein